MHGFAYIHFLRVVALATLLGMATPVPAEGLAQPLSELARVQKEVQRALPRLRPALVGLESSEGAATGVIVSAHGLILTAAHVATDPNHEPKTGRRLRVFFSDGRASWATALGVDVATDAGMARLDGKRNDWPFVVLQPGGADIKTGDWCVALGHPGGFNLARGEVLRVGKILKTSANSLQSDCVLMGGDSGGPLFNLTGELIGIHSQIWEGRDQNVHVSLAPFLRSWDRLRNAEIIRVWAQGSGGWLGVNTSEAAAEGGLKVEDVVSDSPAARAGLRSGDLLLAMDRQPLQSRAAFSDNLSSRPAGDSVVLVVKNRSGERIVTVKLATRPEE